MEIDRTRKTCFARDAMDAIDRVLIAIGYLRFRDRLRSFAAASVYNVISRAPRVSHRIIRNHYKARSLESITNEIKRISRYTLYNRVIFVSLAMIYELMRAESR